jgi:hypothetical protein
MEPQLIGQEGPMIRRLFRHAGSMAVLSWAWHHRGSVARGLDLAKRAPQLLRDGRASDLTAEARAIAALDGALPTDTKVRISGIDDGSVLLRGQPSGDELAAARAALTSLPHVVDVRTDDQGQPTLDSLLTAARP